LASGKREPQPSLKAVIDSFEPLRLELDKGSDLSCALLGATLIENALMTAIAHLLIECPETKSLFDIKGELDGLAKCNKMAFCLGLISKDSYKDIKLIARIRNLFAHSSKPIDFSDEDVTKYCNSLNCERTYPKQRVRLSRGKYKVAVAGEWMRLVFVVAQIRRLELISIIREIDSAFGSIK
jgi:hypothetical protein